MRGEADAEARHRRRWNRAQARAFAALDGAEVSSWSGSEFPLWEGEAGEPIHSHPSAPFLQLMYLTGHCRGRPDIEVGTVNIDPSTLTVREPVNVEHDDTSYTRWRQLDELPTGSLRIVELRQDDEGHLGEVLFDVGSQPLLLVAGETYDLVEDEFRCGPFDESVLVFTDPAAADDLYWLSERANVRSRHPGRPRWRRS